MQIDLQGFYRQLQYREYDHYFSASGSCPKMHNTVIGSQFDKAYILRIGLCNLQYSGGLFRL